MDESNQQDNKGVSTNPKPAIHLNRAVAVIVVVALLIVGGIFLYSTRPSVNRNSSQALAKLNTGIMLSDGGLRYLLSNRSLFDAAFGPNDNVLYDNLSGIAFPYKNTSDYLTKVLKNNASRFSNADLGSYNEAVNSQTNNALYLFNVYDARVTNSSTVMDDTYDLASLSPIILEGSYALVRLFGCGAFHSNETNNMSTTIGITEGLSYGNGDQVITGDSGLPSYYIRSLNGMDYPEGWLGLMITSGQNNLFKLLKTGSIKCSGYNLTSNQYFYILSLTQYDTYPFLSNIYNGTPESRNGITFLGYFKGKLIVELDDFNFTNPGNIILYVDNNTIDYKRYFNYLVADYNLSVGAHVIRINNGTAGYGDTEHIYVSPSVSLDTVLKGNTISVRLYNPINETLSMSNITLTVISSINREYPEIDIKTLPFTSNNTYGYHFYSVPNSLVLGHNASETLNYSLNSTCYPGVTYFYRIAFNTNLGNAIYWPSSECYP